MRLSAEKEIALIVSIAVFASSLMSLGPLSDNAHAGMTWLLETVDTNGGAPSSIDVNSTGQPSILYSSWDTGWSGASLASWTGSSWTIQNVAEGAGLCHSLALDKLDRPHIVYDFDLPWPEFGEMRYTYWNGVSWVNETIDSQGDLGKSCSLALDSLDRPHVSYEDYTWTAPLYRRDLKHAWRNSFGWHNETVDWQGWVGVGNSIAIDSSDRPHIAYDDVTNRTLKYAWWDGSKWNLSVPDPSSDVVLDSPASIRMDSSDRPHIAYMARVASPPDELRYASWTGASWTIERAALITWINSYDSVSLRLDSLDRPYIAYTNHTGFLSFTSEQGSFWVVENIDAGIGSSMGAGASLDLDSGGSPHISYGDGTSTPMKLKYAHRGMDSIPPSSNVDPVVPYWASSDRVITATATDMQSRVANVTLWYRFSPDNSSASWGPWKVYKDADAPPWSWTFTFPDGEGYYQFYSVAVDTGGNVEPPPPTADTIAAYEQTIPSSVLQPVSSYWLNSSPISLTAVASDTPSGIDRVDLYYRYSSNNASWGTWTLFQSDLTQPWSWDFTFPQTSGWYRLYSLAKDRAGNVEDPPLAQDVELALDNYLPRSWLDPVSKGWHSSQINVTAQASDWPSGLSYVDLWYRHSPDKVSWNQWAYFQSDHSPPWSWSFAFPDGDGYYEFYSLATDNVSNSESFKDWPEANATYDATPPEALVDPSQPYWKNVSAVVTATVSDSMSGVANTTLWYRFSSDNSSWDSWRSYTIDSSPPWSWLFDFPSGSSHYQLQATAFDLAGNEDSLGVEEAELGFDPDAPPASMTVGSPSVSDPPTIWVTSSTWLTLTARDGNGSGVASLKFRTWWHGWPLWSDYSDPLILTGEDGLRYLEFQAFDIAGNAGVVENRTMVLDNAPPITTISPATGDFTTDTVFTLSATDGGSGVKTTRYKIDGGNPIDYVGGFTLPEGNHNISYLSTDNLDNREDEKYLNVTIHSLPGPQTRPDYVPIQPTPSTKVRTGMSMSVSLSVKVHNQGNATATVNSRLAFYNETTPATPFLELVVNPVSPGDNSSAFTATWTSPATPGTYRVSVSVDYRDDVSEWDETNNVYTWTIDVVKGPITSLVIGSPNYTSTVTYVRSSTPLNLSVFDQSKAGLKYTRYRIDNYTWIDHSGQFFLAGEGDHYVEWYSEDNPGNVEEVSAVVLRVDDTPPATTIDPADHEATTDTRFTLTATDGGSGVRVTRYRIDGGDWTDYSGFFTLSEGVHNVSYFSIDNLGNREAERYLPVDVRGPPPPPSAEANYKPLVAAVFAIVLAVVGIWSSKKRPWKGGKDRTAVVKAFAFTSIPFVIAEIVTGVVSCLTGELRLPPYVGVGTAVDLVILLAGLGAAILLALKAERLEPEVTDKPESR